MKVTLLDYPHHALHTVVVAAKTCYSSEGPDTIWHNLINEGYQAEDKYDEWKDEKLGKYIAGVIRSGHYSTIEHANFTFAIEGVSRALTHQLVRHRVASYSQQSQRYVYFDGPPNTMFVVPPAVKEAGLEDLFLEACNYAILKYQDLEQKLEDAGRTQEQAKEDARFLLPNAAKTNIVVTMNARELFHIFDVRLCHRAQWEIQALALEMYNLVMEKAPQIFKYAGPNCITSSCKEGKHSCGNPYPKK